jgi:hypothetical protein
MKSEDIPSVTLKEIYLCINSIILTNIDPSNSHTPIITSNDLKKS